jgi:hypothetical protein
MYFNPSVHDDHTIPFQPVEVQREIFKHLSFQDLDAISQVSWAYLRISRNMSILDVMYRKTIKVIESFKHLQLVDTAYLILLKNVEKTQNICQHGLISQAKTTPIIQDSKLNVSSFQAPEIKTHELTILHSEIIQAIRVLLLSSSPKRARKAAQTIESDEKKRLSAFLSIAQISRKPEDFLQVLNIADTCEPLNQFLAYLEVVKNLVDPNTWLKAIREAVTAKHALISCTGLTMIFSKIAEI